MEIITILYAPKDKSKRAAVSEHIHNLDNLRVTLAFFKSSSCTIIADRSMVA